MKRRIGNRKQFFFVGVTALLALGFLATTLISHHVARDSLGRQLADEMLPLTSDNIYSEIQRDLLRPILISSLMASDTFVRDWVLAGEENPEAMSNYLEEIRREYGTITSFFVSDRTLNYYHPDGVVKTVDPEDPRDRWYFDLRDFRAKYDINVDRDTVDRSRLNIFINYRVFDYGGEFIGVTGVGLSVNAVVELINSYQKRYNRQIYFVDREGTVRLHGDSFDPETGIFNRRGQEAVATRLITSPSMNAGYRREDGAEIFVNSRLVPEFDWHLIVEQRADTRGETLDRALLFNIAIALGIMLVVLLIAHFTLRGYQRQLVEMATVDKLTGTLNRNAFENIFVHALKVAARRRQPVTLLLMDLDHFKRINDEYGHQAGDAVLQHVASTIGGIVRETDTLSRWGGEEFMVLLEDCGLEKGLEVAEKIRRQVSERTFTFGREQIAVTLSVGVAEQRAGDTMKDLLNRADTALYSAKQQGRDRVVGE